MDEAIELSGLPNIVKGPLRKAKNRFADTWCDRMHIAEMDRSRFLAPDLTLDGVSNNTSNAIKRRSEMVGSLEERREQYKRRRQTHGLDDGHLLGVMQDQASNGSVNGAGQGGDGAGAGGEQGGARSRGPSGGSGSGGALQVSSAAAGLMAKMGYVEGQGLGRDNQGMPSPLQLAGNRQRAGLGAAGSGPSGPSTSPSALSAKPVAGWAPVPDTAVLTCDQPLGDEEVRAWPPLSSIVMPRHLLKSKVGPLLATPRLNIL